MMELNQTGNILLHISGPCFSGKTYLLSHLIEDFAGFNVITFEKHFDSDNKTLKQMYGHFYQDIFNTLETSNVIGESIYSSSNKILYCKFKNLINIVTYPDYEHHKKNYDRFVEKFGSRVANKRTGGSSISFLRNDFITKGCPPNKILYDGKNYNTVKEEIKNVFRKYNNYKAI
jgi:hypothetical protein